MTRGERSTRWFFIATFPCALLAVGASLWWSYGGESALAFAATVVFWAAAGLLGFVSGLRGEHRQWNVSPHVSGLLTALITLGATLGAMAAANFRTTVTPALTTPTSNPERWVTLVAAEAQESGHGEVLSVLCDKTRPDPGDIGSCAVTYEGPRCQYWFVGSVDGEDEARADEELVDERGVYDPSYGPLC